MGSIARPEHMMLAQFAKREVSNELHGDANEIDESHKGSGDALAG